MRPLACLALSAALLWGAAIPARAAVDVPPDLIFGGQPINPHCFQRADSLDTPVDLATCREDGTVPVTDEEPWFDASAWISETFQWTDMMEDAPNLRGWVAWRPAGSLTTGRWAGAHVVETAYSGGGTGFFTSVAVVRRTGDTLEFLSVLAGGDRCNGGIAAATVAEDTALTAVHITPFDLLALAFAPDDPPARPYEDIVACAACCVGTLLLVNETPALVTLGGGLEGGFDPDPGSPQACLDELMAEGPSVLAAMDLSALATRFRDRCAQ